MDFSHWSAAIGSLTLEKMSGLVCTKLWYPWSSAVEHRADWLACSPWAVPFFLSLAELPDDGLHPSKVYPPMLALALLAMAVAVDCDGYLRSLLLLSEMQNLGCQPSCPRHIIRYVSDKMRQKGLDRNHAFIEERNINMLKLIIIFHTWTIMTRSDIGHN